MWNGRSRGPRTDKKVWKCQTWALRTGDRMAIEPMFGRLYASAAREEAEQARRAADARQDRPKRRRTQLWKPSTGYCRTCRRRKIKCDEQKPSCRRCARTGRECEGYASWATWPVHADDHSAASSDTTAGNDLTLRDNSTLAVIGTSPSEYTVNHVQLFAGLVEGQYRKGAYAAPGPAHAISLLHYIAAQGVSLPLLRNATDTLCLAHLSTRSRDVRVARASQDSQRRLVSLLHRAVANSTSPQPFCSHRDVIASILVLSLAPSTTGPGEQQEHGLSPALIHLNGVMKYLEAHGPLALDEKEPLDYRLLCHVRLLGVFQHLRWRKRVLWDRPEWREVGSIPLSYAPRTVMAYFITRLPGVLEQADAFMATEDGSSAQTQATEAAPLIRTLDELQTKLVGPWLAGPTITKPTVLFASDLGVGVDVMEQPFAASDGYCFTAIYGFSYPSHGFVNAYVRFMCLIADCTLLRMLHHVDAKRQTSSEAFNVRVEDVKERAYFQATELCRYAHFFSGRRSLPAASFLHSMIEGARNFFECSGAQKEAEWCAVCLASNQTRLETLRRDLPPSICPVGELMDGVADSCRYGRPSTCLRSSGGK